MSLIYVKKDRTNFHLNVQCMYTSHNVITAYFLVLLKENQVSYAT